MVGLGWELELPVLDPATLLLVGVCLLPCKGLHGRLEGQAKLGVLHSNPAQVGQRRGGAGSSQNRNLPKLHVGSLNVLLQHPA